MNDIPEWKSLSREEKGSLIRPYIEEQHLSYGQIARIIGVSRVAIVGAANRNKIESPLTAGHTGQRGSKGGTTNFARGAPRRAAEAKKRQDKPTRSAVRPLPAPPLDADITAPPVIAAAWLPLPGSTPRPLAEHKTGECAWPIEQGDKTLFCCLPAVEGSSWCAVHNAMGRRPAPLLKLKGKRL